MEGEDKIFDPETREFFHLQGACIYLGDQQHFPWHSESMKKKVNKCF